MTRADNQHLHKHPAMPRLGQRLDERYELLEVLGEGGASVVYRARDVLAGGEVAVKVLSPRKSRDPAFSRRFGREARLLRELEHPNIVKVADVGTTETGCLFIVQELLIGSDLAETIEREGPLPVERVIRIASQVLRALLEAHRLGVVHRDLKPQNIMICDFAGESDFIKVLDFGMAKATVSDGVETAPGQVLVTPAYAAPELLSGGPATPAADIYALGLLCLEMLTGEQTVKSPTVWGLIAWQSSDVPVEIPPAVRALPISRVLAKAVRKDRNRRFQNAREMLDALAQPESVDAIPEVVLGSRPDPPRSRKWLAHIAVAGVLVAAIAGALWLEFGRVPRPEADSRVEIATTPLAACRRNDFDACLAVGLDSTGDASGSLDEAEVLEALERACVDGRRSLACRTLGERYRDGLGVDVDLDHASSFGTRACELGDIETCLEVGYDHLSGARLTLDRRRARHLLEPACEAGRASACAAVAAMYANGWEVDPDLSRAAQLYERACQGDVATACTHLGALAQQGRGVEQDLERARMLYERSCDRGDPSGCANLGTLFHRGLGVEVDLERARGLYTTACHSDVAPACAGLGTIDEAGVGGETDLPAALAAFTRACELGEPIGCVGAARRIRADGGEGSDEQARAHLRRACELGYAPACR